MDRYLRLFLLFFLSTANAFAVESFEEYLSECKTALEVNAIPGFSCYPPQNTSANYVSQLVPDPSELIVPSGTSYIGKVDTGNPNVDAMFLCRSVNTSTDTVEFVTGYILQNRINGKTCFFDSKEDVPTTAPPIEDSAQSKSYWRSPGELVSDCVICHKNDAFFVSPAVVEAFADFDLLYNGRNLFGPYRAVNGDNPNSYFSGWDADIATANSTPPNAEELQDCAGSCHRTPSGWYFRQEGLRSIMDGWMPPTASGHYVVDDPFVLNNSYTIENVQYSQRLINTETGNVTAEPVQLGLDFAKWSFEKVGEHYRIKNMESPREFLYIDASYTIKSGEIDTSMESALWKLVEVDAAQSIYRIRNEEAETYLIILFDELTNGWVTPANPVGHWYLDIVN